MTEQQQKLYEKLLKKVNEYCLGAAAEDVIAAIDALVENYESIHTTLCTIATDLGEQVADKVNLKVDPASKPLQALENIIETFVDKDSEDIKKVRKVLKAFHLIIDRRCDIHYIGFFTIINHELEMSKDETKFVEDALNESTN